MPRFIRNHFLTFLLALVFIACHSDNNKVAARTSPSPAPPRFHDAPKNSPVAPLVYDTTNPQIQEIISRLDVYYHAQARSGFNGSVLVGYKGRVIYERYFGYANREQHMPLQPNSACQLASISKTFTGAAILYLHEKKYLNINDPVQDYIKDFPYQGITIKMLLSHRSGLPDYTKWVPNFRNDERTPINNETMLQMMAKYRPGLEFRPNSRFKYCNTNFAVLARIIEITTEIDYRTFMRKYIFEPLHMNNTFVYDPAKGLPISATISYKYNWVREPDMFADGVYGDKGIYSTVEDMYRWDQSFYENKLLSNETIEMAYGPCSFEKPGIKNYGLGWRMLCYPDGGKIIYHNGWWHGNNTSFYRFIKDNFTIIILGNKHNNTIYHQAPAIFSIIKGAPPSGGFDTEG